MQLSAEQDVSSEGSTYAKLDKVERIIPEKSDKIILHTEIITLRTLWCIGKPQKIMLIVTHITEVIVEYIPGLGFIEIRRTVQVIERK